MDFNCGIEPDKCLTTECDGCNDEYEMLGVIVDIKRGGAGAA